MSPEMVERVADRLHAAAHPYREGALDTKAPEYRLRWHKAARYALALAERAAMEAFRDGWFSARGSVPGLGCHVKRADTEAAVQRAVEDS